MYPLEDNADIDIGRLTFTGGPGNTTVNIVLGFGDINQNDTPVTPVGRDWGGLDASNLTDAAFAGAINGDLVGSIEVPYMWRFDVYGEVQAPIEVGSPYPGGFLVLEAEKVTTGGSVLVDSGDIRRVKVYGDLLGPVVATSGAIHPNGVEADGTIGSAGSPVAITAGYGNLAQVTAQAIYANITAVEGPQYSGYLERLEATNGQFVGSIVAHELRNNGVVSEFSCVGDMDADITTEEGINGNPPGNLADPLIITGGDFPLGRTLSVTSLADWDGAIQITEDTQTGAGGHLYGDLLFSGTIGPNHNIELDNGLCGLVRIDKNLIGNIVVDGTPGQTDEGITGQVIINAENSTNTWTGAVTVNGTPLAPIPYYDNRSSEVGGGAVGLVPYYLHYGDCSPSGVKRNEATNGLDGLGLCEYGFHAQKRVPKDTSWNSVTLVHLGPIAQEGAGKPFKVWRKGLMSLCGWEDRTADFTYTMHPNGVDRAIQINGSFEGGYDWLIEPNTGGSDFLYCGELEESVGKVPVLDDDYRLRVLDLQDITANGLIQPDDITEWLANPIDTTLDGVTDSADLIDVTEAVAESGDW